MPDDLLNTFRDRLRTEAGPALCAEIERAVLARRDERSGHTAWGLLCEEAGLLNLAFREFQLALRDDPKDAVASFHLAHHYRERGDTGRAARLLEGLLPTEPAREDWLTRASSKATPCPARRSARRSATSPAGCPATARSTSPRIGIQPRSCTY